MSILRNKKTKTIAFLLAVLLLIQGGSSLLSAIAGNNLDDNSHGFETLGFENLGESGIEVLGLSTVTLGASKSTFAVGDILLTMTSKSGELVENSKNEYEYQSYVAYGDTIIPDFQVDIDVIPTKIINTGGKIELTFDSELGYDLVGGGTGNEDFFTYKGINGSLSSLSMFESVDATSVPGKIIIKIKDGTYGKAETISLNFKYNTNYAAAAPPKTLLAKFAATAHANGSVASAEEKIDVYSQSSIYPYTQYGVSYPGMGTQGSPAIFKKGEVISEIFYTRLNEARFTNKLDYNAYTPKYTYILPVGSTITGNSAGAYVKDAASPRTLTQAEMDSTGAPQGSYDIWYIEIKTGNANNGWNFAPDGNPYRNEWNVPINIKLDENLIGEQVIYRMFTYQWLGSDKVGYASPENYYVAYEDGVTDYFQLAYIVQAMGMNTISPTDTGINDGDISKNFGQIGGYPYNDQRHIRNQGTVAIKDFEYSFEQQGAGPGRINYDFVTLLYATNDKVNVPIQNFAYYFTIENENGSSYKTAETIVDASKGIDIADPTAPSAVGSNYISKDFSVANNTLPDLNTGDYIKSVHFVPYGTALNEQSQPVPTRGVMPPKTFFRMQYRARAWDGQKWPDGSDVDNDVTMVPIDFKLTYKDDSAAGGGAMVSKYVDAIGPYGEDAVVRYLGNSPYAELYGSQASDNLNGLEPGDSVKYRINARNNTLWSNGVWKNPAVIVQLPEGMELDTTAPIDLYDATGTVQGAVNIVSEGKENGKSYYRLVTPAAYEAPKTSGANIAFYMDVTIKVLPKAYEGTYAPQFIATSGTPTTFHSTMRELPINTLPDNETLKEYGLLDGEKFSYMSSQSTSAKLSVAGKSDSTYKSEVKSVKSGGWSSASIVAADFGEVAEVKLTIKNDGNIRLGGFKLYDRVPFAGFNGSSTECSVALESIQAPGNPTIYYYTGPSNSAPILDGIDIINLSGANWSTTADPKTATAFFLDFGNYIINPSESFEVILKFQIPSDETKEQTAMNQFTYLWGNVNQWGNQVTINETKSSIQGFSTESYAVIYNNNHGEDIVDSWPNPVDNPDQSGILTGSNTVSIVTTDPVRPGYTFVGWFEDKNSSTGFNWKGGQITFTPSKKVLNVYDHWAVNTSALANVTIDLNGGALVPTSSFNELNQTKNVKAKVNFPPNAEIKKGGYDFKNWYTLETVVDVNNVSSTVEVAWQPAVNTVESIHVRESLKGNPLKIYAAWEANGDLAEVTFKHDTAAAAEVTSALPAKQNKAVDAKLDTVADPVRPGWKFEGWLYNSAAWNLATDVIKSAHYPSIQLVSSWSIDSNQKISVTYDANGGKFSTGLPTNASGADYFVGTKVSAPTGTGIPEKLGFTVDKWQYKVVDSVSGAETFVDWNFAADDIASKHIKDGLTLYAKWKGDINNKLLVKYADSINDGYIVTMPNDEDVLAGTTVTKPTTPVRPGYTFKGWYNAGKPWKFNETKIDSVHYTDFNSTLNKYVLTLEAQWFISNGEVETIDPEVDGGENGGPSGPSVTLPNEIMVVTFVPQGGKITHSYNGAAVTLGTDESLIVKDKFHVEDTLDTLPTIKRGGYKFEGWFANIGTGAENDWVSGDKLTSVHYASGKTLKLTAKWSIDPNQTISVAFDLDGGKIGTSTTVPNQTGKKINDTIILPAPNPQKVGYIFLNWYDSDNMDGSPWTNATVIASSHFDDANGLTIKAKWAVNNGETVAVKFVDDPAINDGYVVAMPSSVAYNAEEVIAKPSNPVRPGYTFDGWKYKGSIWKFATKITSENFSGTAPNYEMILTASWKVSDGTGGTTNVTIPVTLDPNGGKINGSSANIVEKLHVTEKPSKLPTPTKAGYKFGGWVENYNNPTNETPWTISSLVTSTHMEKGSLTIVAKWSIDAAVTIDTVFKLNGGNINGSTSDIKLSGKHVEDILTIPVTPQKEGHEFIGWFDGIGTSSEKEWTASSQVTIEHMEANKLEITAKWKALPFTITYDAKGGTPAPASQTLDYGTVIKLPEVTKADHVLNGWIDSSGKNVGISGVNYSVKAKDETLSADWSLLVYALNYDKEVKLQVNDRYPAKNNELTIENFTKAINASATSSIAKTRAVASGVQGTPKVTSPDLAQLDYSEITAGYDQTVTINFEWTAGQKETAVVKVRMVDTIAPVIEAEDKRRIDFRFSVNDKAWIKTEAELMTLIKANEGINITDNYDLEPMVTLEYTEGSFDKIDWKKAGVHGLYIDAQDSSGNNAVSRKAIIINLISVETGENLGGDNGGSGGKKPDIDSPLPGGDNGSGNTGKPGTGTGAGNNSGGVIDGGNLPDGSKIDGNGNLVDKNGNILVLANKLPNGAVININGELVDAKGNLIILDGNAAGNTPSTGIMQSSYILPILLILMAIALMIFALKRRKDTEQQW